MDRVLPKPDDVPVMMLGWQKLAARLMEGGAGLEPSFAAAVASLSLLLIHPFEDGNAQLQRVLAETMLRRLAQNLPLPLARALDREKSAADTVAHQFFQSIEGCIDFDVESTLTAGDVISVRNESAWLYRYADLTPLVETFCTSVDKTIREEVRPALAFYAVQDSVLQALQHVVDLPGGRATLLVRLLLLHRWKIPEPEWIQFPELSAGKWQQLESLGSQHFHASC
jgi:hypothetical protein